MSERQVTDHYAVPELAERIVRKLAEAGHDLDRLTTDDLAPFDMLHVRGRASTEELARAFPADLAPRAGEEWIDVGSGLGGTARFLTQRFGCRVQGVDLTPEFCRAAGELSRLVGLDGAVSFRVGDALALPFEDERFDGAWTEHVQMNVTDKRGFYGEIARVLRPGGRFGFHDIFQGDERSPLTLPVPWASSPEHTHLRPAEDVRALLVELGLEEVSWIDVTEAARAFFREASEREQTRQKPIGGLRALLGESAGGRLRGASENAEAGRLRVVRAVFRARPR